MHSLRAFSDLLRHYVAVFAASWKARHTLLAPKRLSHELAFLPASLELAEMPVHPAPRWAMALISALALLAITVGLVGKLDIVAVAKGKLLPNDRVKVVQAAVTGVVRKILVRDGQRVAAGDLLLELDPRQAEADSSKAQSARVSAALAAVRAEGLLDAEAKGRAVAVPSVTGASLEEQTATQQLADGLLREHRDKVASAEAEAIKREAELQTTERQIAKLRATAPLARQQADDYAALVQRKYVTKTDYLQKEQSALELEHELNAQMSHAAELRAAVSEQKSTLAQTKSEFRREQMEALEKAKQQLAQNQNDETKSRTREDLMTLRAPVAGTVQQLSVFTVGGVVTTAQSLMEIVPDDTMEVEATVENKDVGFIHPGQDAVVKIEAFPYARYGYLQGRVKSVSNNAVQDKKMGLIFVARIELPTNKIQVNGSAISLTPGMAVTTEINTGRRSVAGYFLDPLMQASQESLRER